MESAVPETKSVRQELSEVPLSDLLALRDRVGTKEFYRVYHNRNKPSIQVPPRKDKERPPEFSSKKRPRPVRKGTGDRNRPRDPRFDERAGPLCEEGFGRAYAFLDQLRETERCEVEREVRRAGKADTSQLIALLDRMRAQARARGERNRDREVERRWVRAEREKVGQGKRRFYLKSGALRRMQLEARLGGQGGKREVDKRRKRMEKRSRRKIPQRRGQKGMQTIL